MACGFSEEGGMEAVHTYHKMNETIKDLLRRSEEPMQQYILTRIEELEKALLDAETQHRTEYCEAAQYDCKEHGELEAYKATGMTPEDVFELIGVMRGACTLCGMDSDDATPDAPKAYGCRYKDCGCHKWRTKWFKEAEE